MLRSINARAIAQTRLLPQIGQASVRRISMARPSAVALGKRPALPLRSSAVIGMMSARHISFFGGKSQTAVSASAPTEPTLPSSAGPHSAQATAAAAEPVLSTPDVALATPVPSSDIPDVPVENPLPPAQHLTSAAPDHHFATAADGATPALRDLVTNSNLPLEEVLNSPEAINAAVSVADLKLIGLDHGVFNLAGWFRDALVSLDNLTGLPWWANIILFSIGLRMSLVPYVINNARHNVRLQAISPQMQGLMARIKEAKLTGDSSAMMVASSNLQKLFKEYNVNPIRPILLPLLQMPVFLGMFYALRGLAAAPLPALKAGGFGHILDLTLPDPLYILPITSILMQLAVFKVGVDGTGANGARNARQMAHFRNGLLCLSPILVAITSSFPAAVLLYWTTANTFTLVQAYLLRQPWVKSLCKIPEAPHIPAPPSELVLDPNPSIRDTYNALMEWGTTFREKALQQAEADALARADAAREKALRKPVGTAQLFEKVQEQPRAESATVETTVSQANPAPTEPATPEGSNSMYEDAPLSREDAKRARVAAARAKRGNRA